MKVCVPQGNASGVETINGMKQINTSRRKSARNLRNSERWYVPLSFRSSRFGTAGFIFHAQMEKKKAELVRISTLFCWSLSV